MGSEQTLIRFGHNHPLEISAYQETKNSPTKCSACKLNPSGWICTCKKCNYLIHFQCSQIPNHIQLPFHKEHILSLLPKPGSPSRTFTCRSCNKQGDGFSYSCTDCSVHIHILCATMPQIVTHESHDHPLDLIFSPPHGTHIFHCNICQGRGDNHWLYYCKTCGFYAHLSCAAPKPTFAFSSSSTGTDKVSDKKEIPKVIPKSTFVGSSFATVSSKASTENDDDGDWNITNLYESSGADIHSGGPTTKLTSVGDKKESLKATPKSTFTGSDFATANSNASTKKNDDDDGNKTKRYESSRVDSNSGGPTTKAAVVGSSFATGTGKANDKIGSSSFATGTTTEKPTNGGSKVATTPKPTFVGSNSSTGSSKVSTKNNDDDDSDDGDDDVGNDTRYGTVPGGFDAHSGGTTQKQTFPSAKPTTGTGKATNSSSTPLKENNSMPGTKFNNYDIDDDNSDNDDITDYRKS